MKNILTISICAGVLLFAGCATKYAIEKKTEPVNKPTAVIETTAGTMEIELMPGVAPKACENFAGLAKKGYYDGLIFHRVIKGFMIQGGDPTGTGRGGESLWGKPFEDEVTPEVTFDSPGMLAMANAGPVTNGSQFFITTAKTPWLNMRHTIFGKLVRGEDTLKRIEMTRTGENDRPIEDQKIIRIVVKSAPDVSPR